VTTGEALQDAVRRLTLHSSNPRLDAEVLLAHTLKLERASLLARLHDQLPVDVLSRFGKLIARREKGEPVAYLTGHKEFYNLDLIVTKDVLVPRPETESVVDASLEALPINERSQLADIGTGSGAIVVAVTANRPLLTAFATDISPQALEVAARNCALHGVADRVTLLQGDLLDPLPEPVNVIAANLPYIPPGEASPEVATWEPHIAVFGGDDDGTALIRRFLQTAPRYLLPGGRVVMETAYSQGQQVAALARSAFPNANVEIRKDLADYDRIVVVQT
jgi:release factor glutamine methyltransferase